MHLRGGKWCAARRWTQLCSISLADLCLFSCYSTIHAPVGAPPPKQGTGVCLSPVFKPSAEFAAHTPQINCNHFFRKPRFRKKYFSRSERRVSDLPRGGGQRGGAECSAIPSFEDPAKRSSNEIISSYTAPCRPGPGSWRRWGSACRHCRRGYPGPPWSACGSAPSRARPWRP